MGEEGFGLVVMSAAFFILLCVCVCVFEYVISLSLFGLLRVEDTANRADFVRCIQVCTE